MKLSKKLKRKLKKRLLVAISSISIVFLLFAVGKLAEDPVLFEHLMTSGRL